MPSIKGEFCKEQIFFKCSNINTPNITDTRIEELIKLFTNIQFIMDFFGAALSEHEQLTDVPCVFITEQEKQVDETLYKKLVFSYYGFFDKNNEPILIDLIFFINSSGRGSIRGFYTGVGLYENKTEAIKADMGIYEPILSIDRNSKRYILCFGEHNNYYVTPFDKILVCYDYKSNREKHLLKNIPYTIEATFHKNKTLKETEPLKNGSQLFLAAFHFFEGNDTNLFARLTWELLEKKKT